VAERGADAAMVPFLWSQLAEDYASWQEPDRAAEAAERAIELYATADAEWDPEDVQDIRQTGTLLVELYEALHSPARAVAALDRTLAACRHLIDADSMAYAACLVWAAETACHNTRPDDAE